MKTKKLLTVIIYILFAISFGCKKELLESKIYQENALLKQILLFSYSNPEHLIGIVAEYEYDEEKRIIQVSRPMSENGINIGTFSYDIYEYNCLGKLEKINNYHSNNNASNGFINLKNIYFFYDNEGNVIKESIEYVQIGTTEYFILHYNENKLVKKEKYGFDNQLENYTIYSYNDFGLLIEEKNYTSDNLNFQTIMHSYIDGLNVRTDYFGTDEKIHTREITRVFDKNKNLIKMYSNELSIYSSMMSYIFDYVYFDN